MIFRLFHSVVGIRSHSSKLSHFGDSGLCRTAVGTEHLQNTTLMVTCAAGLKLASSVVIELAELSNSFRTFWIVTNPEITFMIQNNLLICGFLS